MTAKTSAADFPAAAPCFGHLSAMTDEVGLFEHALLDEPRRELGYCVDDVARGLVVTSREPRPGGRTAALTEIYLQFVLAAVGPDGRSRNRRSIDGAWTDSPSVADCWGRAVSSLGTAAVLAPLPSTRLRARMGFELAAGQRSPYLRATAFAMVGAAEVLRAGIVDAGAAGLLEDGLSRFPSGCGGAWPWPEARLRYGNGSVPEALILAGAALGDDASIEWGLALLEFLLRVETREGRLSVTGTSGRGPGETGPQFDQQPLEAAAIADASVRAFQVTGDPQWLCGLDRAVAWFDGDNDSGTPMTDPAGGGFDGLTRDGRNENRGAESTLAALMTRQHARRLRSVRRTR